ncbi:hypothetical protein [Sporomusa aerivorans]|uniref:phage tail tube protein n=1 Tax=Sporomusa aerivorans TaxID=204936 RepID=UPI00352AB56A
MDTQKTSLVFDLQRFGTPSPKNLLLGAGPIYFDRLDDDGNSTGLRNIGSTDDFKFKTEVTKVTKKSSLDKARRTYAEAVKEIGATGSITMTEFDPANLALALYGEEGVITQEAQEITDEVYTVKLGQAIQLPYYKVKDVVVEPLEATGPVIGEAASYAVTGTGTVTSGGTYTGTTTGTYYVAITAANTTAGDISGCKFKWRKSLTGVYSEEIEATGEAQELAEGVTATLTVATGKSFAVNDIYSIAVTPASGAYTLGKDYKVPTIEARGGLITFPTTSSIEDGAQVKISYSVPAATFPKVSGATVSSVEGMLLFLGDPSHGPTYNGEFWHVSITPNGEIGMISDDFATFGIDFTCLDDSENHPDDPLYRLVKLA